MKNLNSGDGVQLPLNVPSEGLIEMLEQRIAFLKRGIAQLNDASIDLSQKVATSAEVCALLNISDRTLKTLRDNRQIGFSQVGRKVFYTAEDIQRYINTFERVSNEA